MKLALRPSFTPRYSSRCDRLRGALLALLLLLPACADRGSSALLRQAPPRNLLLITIDTLRADRVGCYGYSGARTPNLDRLASEGVRFENAIAPAPITLPSHASILTGRYPAAHGIRSNGRERLPRAVPTLAEGLHERFTRRSAIVASVTLDRLFGLDRGFLEYDDRMPAHPSASFLERQERPAAEVAGLAERWIAGADEPFLLWVHLFDPHAPYHPPSPFREQIADPYDAEIAAADEAVGRILSALEHAGELERTLVVVAGDHGEDLNDHGEPTHGVFLYDTSIRVPLLFRYPVGLPAGRVVSEQVRLIDILPTLLDIVGTPVPDGVQGTSLVPLLTEGVTGRTDDREAYVESLLPALQYGWSPLQALRTNGWKYVAAPEEELYDLAVDPAEKNNLAASRPQNLAEYRSRLARARESAGSIPSEVAQLSGEMRRQLESLGYVGGHTGGAGPSRGEAAPGSNIGADPKRMAHLLEPLERSVAAFEAGRMEEAGSGLSSVLERGPGNVFARRILARSLLARSRTEEGRGEYLKLLQNTPGDAEALNTLATLDLRAGRFDEAEERFRAAAEASPWDPRIRSNLAFLSARRGEVAEAERILVEVLREHPRQVEAALNLAGLRRKLGRLPEAEQALRDLLREAPGEPSATRALAGLLREQGRTEEARRLLSESDR